jgi:hypothetical protein
VTQTNALAKNNKEINVLPEEKIYETIYKKGNMLNKMHFKFTGDLDSAVQAVKDWCAKHYLKHIHTVHFLTDLNDENLNGSSNFHSEEIDITR